MQLTLTILAVTISILFLYKKYFYNNPEKGCGGGDCDCK
jgi:hypothetical protein